MSLWEHIASESLMSLSAKPYLIAKPYFDSTNLSQDVVHVGRCV